MSFLASRIISVKATSKDELEMYFDLLLLKLNKV